MSTATPPGDDPSPGRAPLVVVDGLVRRFGEVTAVDGVDLQVHAGEVVCLLGPNGAGKSSTLAAIEGLARPDGGTVRTLGLDPFRDAAAVRPRIGVMLQSGGAHLSARVGEMLRLLARQSARPLDVDWLLRTLGLAEHVRRPIRRLSGGQVQRLHLAMALVGRPELVVLDEPTAGMDPQARHLVWELVAAVRRDGVGVLLTTHLMDEAERLADRIVIIDHGRVVADGSPAALLGAGEQQLGFLPRPALPAAALAEIAAALPDHRLDPTGDGRVRLTGPVTGAVVAAVTAVCARYDVVPDELRTGSGSLDEVYLALTGREVRG